MESGLGLWLWLWLGLELEFKQGFLDLEDGLGFAVEEGLALVLDLIEERRMESGGGGGGGGGGRGRGACCGGGGLRSLGGVAEM